MPSDPRSAVLRMPTGALVGIALLGASFCAGLAGCDRRSPADLDLYVFQGGAMGTTYTVKVVCAASAMYAGREGAIEQAIGAALIYVDDAMSTYKPDSELSRFNQYRGTEPYPLSPATFTVFSIAQQISVYTNGAFDVTVGPLVNAWGFGAEKPAGLPTDAEIASILTRVGYQKLHLDSASQSVTKAVPDLYCDLSSVAEGFAVDEIAHSLDALGCTDYMVELGGEVRTRGLNQLRQPWHIGIQRPDLPDRHAAGEIALVSNVSLSTSGDYRKSKVAPDGTRYTHHIDPATGRPVQSSLASVSVIHPECAIADALSTALMVMGTDRAYQFAMGQGIAAYLIVHTEEGGYSVLVTPSFQAYLGTAPQS